MSQSGHWVAVQPDRFSLNPWKTEQFDNHFLSCFSFVHNCGTYPGACTPGSSSRVQFGSVMLTEQAFATFWNFSIAQRPIFWVKAAEADEALGGFQAHSDWIKLWTNKKTTKFETLASARSLSFSGVIFVFQFQLAFELAALEKVFKEILDQSNIAPIRDWMRIWKPTLVADFLGPKISKNQWRHRERLNNSRLVSELLRLMRCLYWVSYETQALIGWECNWAGIILETLLKAKRLLESFILILWAKFSRIYQKYVRMGSK